MATIVLTIPDAVLSRVVNALCDRGNYSPQTDGAKGPFAKGVVVDFVKTVTRNYEADLAAKTAHDAARDAADVDIAIT